MEKKKFPYTQNREISWLKFNQRVLEEAADPKVELLERLKFAAIFTSNLDEFFMVRAGSLTDMALVNDHQVDAKSGMHPSEQLSAIYEEARRLYSMRDSVIKNIIKTLKAVQIEPLSMKNLNKKQLKYVTKYFDTQLAPLLAVQIMDVHHPFPFLVNKAQYIFFQINEGNKTRYGIVPLPEFIPRLIFLNEEKTQYILSETVIAHFLDRMFPKAKIPFKTIIRVTRNADINLNAGDIEDDEDYRQYMKKILKRRLRLSPVRLELYRNTDQQAVDYLCRQLKISPSQVFLSRRSPLDLSFVFGLIDSLPNEIRIPLSYHPLVSQTTSQLDPSQSLIDQILKKDVLLSYPYQDIDIFIDLLREASTSPLVRSINITIYRLAKNSQILKYLCRAAENGKNVTVLMELRARFDEQNNIQAAERLEEAGCQVYYGFDDYKVHSKVMQITLQKGDKISTITQIGTGNYNEKTSRQYTDLSFLTSREDIGKDASAFFNNLNTGNLNGTYEKLLVSPHSLKAAVMEKLDEQIERAKAGLPASAFFKMNSITDLELIEKLSQASQSGVKIRMIVRGICCLLPGIAGYTENIEIHSIVGRFLEHARIYGFGQGEDCQVYISSADFMTRNTERRVEVAVPIEEKPLKQMLIEYFDTQFADDAKGRKLLPSGYYTDVPSSQDEPIDCQAAFIEKAAEDRFIPSQNSSSKAKSGVSKTVSSLFERIHSWLFQAEDEPQNPAS